MQPYFLPYIGYWQLLNAVDEYVIYDDVNFIKGGWINRNRILNHTKPQYINVYLKGASPNLRICDIKVEQAAALKNKTIRMLENCYSKAPYFKEGYELAKGILLYPETNLALFLANSIQVVCDYLSITTKLHLSSELEKDNTLHGQDKVLAVCELLHAQDYYNAIGGRELYSFEAFRKRGICLHFVQTDDMEYPQAKNEFVPNLSILDVIMFNSKERIQEMLKDYTLISE